MLTSDELSFMQTSQDEIYTLRQRDISVIYLELTYDDFTGELVGETEKYRPIKAVVTEISNRNQGEVKYMEDGIEYEQGDAKFDIKIEYIEDIVDKLVRIEYDGNKYEMLGVDKKGIGARNRYEFIGRVIA